MVFSGPRPLLLLGLFACFYSHAQIRMIPHVSKQSGGFIPTLLVANADDGASHTVQLEFFEMDGDSITTSSVTVQPGETLYVPPSQLSGSENVSHIVIEGDEEVVVTMIYTSTAENVSPVHVGETDVQSTRWRFYQGNWSAAWDGIAIVNPTDTVAEVSIAQFVSGRERANVAVSVESWRKSLMVMDGAFEDIEGSYFEIQSPTALALTCLRGSLDQRFLWENVAVDLQHVGMSSPDFSLLWQTEFDGSIRAGGQVTTDWWYLVTQSPAKAYRIALETGNMEQLSLPGDIADVWEHEGDVYFLTDMDLVPDGFADFDSLTLSRWNPNQNPQVQALTSIPVKASEIGFADANRIFVQHRFCEENGRIVAVDIHSGAIIWNEELLNCTVHYYLGDLISVATATGNEMRLIRQTDGSAIDIWDSPGALSQFDGTRFYGTVDRENTVVAAGLNGNRLWEYDSAFSETLPTLNAEGLFFYVFGKPSGKRDLVMLNPLNGLEIWKQTDALSSSAVVAHSGSLVLLATGTTLLVLDGADGAQIESLAMSNWALTGINQLRVASSRLLALTSDSSHHTFTAIQLP